MPSVFSRILAGDLPGRFVFRNERTAAFLSNAPLRPGHTLVVPVVEADHWIDLAPGLLTELMATAHTVARAIDRAYAPAKVALMIAGLEVPHVHVHLVPIDDVHDLDFERQNREPSAKDLDEAQARIRAALAELAANE